jgi:zinc transporter
MQIGEPDIASAEPLAGIVWAFRFAESGQAQPLGPEAVNASLRGDGGWTWVHLKLGDARCRAWIANHAPVTDWSREVLLGADEHLYLDFSGAEVIGILPDLQLEFARPTEEIGRLRFSITDRMLITTRRSPLRSVEKVRKLVEGGEPYTTPWALLDAIVDGFASSIRKRIFELRDELDRVEDHVLGESIGDERQRLGRVRVQVTRIHRQLAQLRTLLHRFEARASAATTSLGGVVTNLAQKFDELDTDANSVNERARLLQDEVAAKLNELTSRRLFALSLLTAVLLPPTLVTGFFGMNTQDLPLQAAAGGSWVALVLAAAAGGLTFWALQQLRVL